MHTLHVIGLAYVKYGYFNNADICRIQSYTKLL
jgi:hypothetical protein